MFDSPNQSRRATAAKLLVALMSATGCLAAVAYATTTPAARDAPSRGSRAPSGTARGRCGRASFVIPAKTTLSTRVSFRYTHRQAPGVALSSAGSTTPAGSAAARRSPTAASPSARISFLVRAVTGDRPAQSSRPRFAWVQAQPKSLAIAAELSALSRLYPAPGTEPVPLLITNPNPAPIEVTASPSRSPPTRRLPRPRTSR